MKYQNLRAIFVTLLIMVITSVEAFKKFSEVCNVVTSNQGVWNFKELPNTKNNYDTINYFLNGKKIGKGSFGLVHKSQYTSRDGINHKVAIKKITFSQYQIESILNELSALTAVYQSNHFPRLWGCTMSTNSEIYMVQELLNKDLGSVAFRDYLRSESKENSLRLYKQMFTAVKYLWDAGFVHNDIKPENMMTNDEMTRIYLIDLGLAQKNTDYNSSPGTPYFRSPSKMTKRGKVSPKDDFYSIAMSIAVMEAKSYDDIFIEEISGGYGKQIINDACFLVNLIMDCRIKLGKNIVRVLSGQNYGDYQSAGESKETINFTTLIANMILYDEFKFTHDEVLQIMNQLILNENKVDLKKKLKDEEQADLMKTRNDYRKANKKIKGLKIEKQNAMNFKKLENAKYLQESAFVIENSDEQNNFENRHNQAKLDNDKNIADAEFNYRQMKIAFNEKYNKNAGEQSRVFNENKILFQKIMPVVFEEKNLIYKKNELNDLKNLVDKAVKDRKILEEKVNNIKFPKIDQKKPKENYNQNNLAVPLNQFLVDNKQINQIVRSPPGKNAENQNYNFAPENLIKKPNKNLLLPYIEDKINIEGNNQKQLNKYGDVLIKRSNLDLKNEEQNLPKIKMGNNYEINQPYDKILKLFYGQPDSSKNNIIKPFLGIPLLNKQNYIPKSSFEFGNKKEEPFNGGYKPNKYLLV